MRRLTSSLQRWATGSPARCTTASRPASPASGAGPAMGSHPTASTPSRAAAPSGLRDSTVTSSPRSRSARTSRTPIRPVAPVRVIFMTGVRSPVRARSRASLGEQAGAEVLARLGAGQDGPDAAARVLDVLRQAVLQAEAALDGDELLVGVLLEGDEEQAGVQE